MATASNIVLSPGETFTKRCSKKRPLSVQSIILLPTQFITITCRNTGETIQVSCGVALINAGSLVLGRRQQAKVTCSP
ncbi:hypothetical protein [Ectobacillus panaciterrae]|uniref:hypothetical protein n=1 Tax=Ectobacillus panaciterrae TaxID=363872 RepID=UPI00048C2978|nr:hypothetical protein [Ectobacillus panaciterrae]